MERELRRIGGALFTASVVFCAGVANADPEYTITSPSAVACSSEAELASVTNVAASDALPPNCEILPHGFNYESMNREIFYWPDAPSGRSLPMIGGRYLIKGNEEAHYFYVLKRDTDQVLGAEGGPVEPSCSIASGGVITRVEADEHGVLRLRRYEIVNRCANGKMISSSKLLNP